MIMKHNHLDMIKNKLASCDKHTLAAFQKRLVDPFKIDMAAFELSCEAAEREKNLRRLDFLSGKAQREDGPVNKYIGQMVTLDFRTKSAN